jgi:hypothetical protein
MSFVTIQNNAARAAMKAFRLSGQYYYEDRISGCRVELTDVVEVPIEFYIDDPNTGVTITRKGRRFLILKTDKELVDTFRTGKGYDISMKPTPNRGDFIVAVKDNIETKYQIDDRDPYSVTGSNNDIYSINTFLV